MNTPIKSADESAPQYDAVETAIMHATMYAVAQGDRYVAARRKTVANAFYSALPLLADIRKNYREAMAAAPTLHESDVQWIVNDNAELGVMINGQAFFLYKGDSLVYEQPQHDDGRPMHYRTVGKREFGECCHPINYQNPQLIGTVSLSDSDRWRPLPAGRGVSTAPDGMAHLAAFKEAAEFMLAGRPDELRSIQRHADGLLAAAPAAQVADRDAGGRLVREAWIRWAQQQPNPKPSWLAPYDELSEADKEADRQIYEAIVGAAPAVVVDEAMVDAEPAPILVRATVVVAAEQLATIAEDFLRRAEPYLDAIDEGADAGDDEPSKTFRSALRNLAAALSQGKA